MVTFSILLPWVECFFMNSNDMSSDKARMSRLRVIRGQTREFGLEESGQSNPLIGIRGGTDPQASARATESVGLPGKLD